MEQSDIKEVINILKNATEIQDWDTVEEAIEYLYEFYDDDDDLNDEEI
jgi:hypothetical protein